MPSSGTPTSFTWVFLSAFSLVQRLHQAVALDIGWDRPPSLVLQEGHADTYSVLLGQSSD